MMRMRACWCLLVALMATTTVYAQSVSVVDDRGTTVRLAQPARRVVSLLPSLTETVCTLGACDRMVAVDRWSDWPVSVQRLPKVGSLDDVNVEGIVALKPDLVLAAPSSRVAERLRGLGLTVAELDAQDMAGVERVLTRIGVLLGRADASRLAWAAVQQKLALAQAQVPLRARGVRVYFEVSTTPYAAGEASFIGQLLTRLGAVNVVPQALGPFPKLNPEYVVRADPALILLDAESAAGLAQRPGWGRLQAVRQGRVCALSTLDYNMVARPGPRLGDAAMVLAQCLRVHGLSQHGVNKP